MKWEVVASNKVKNIMSYLIIIEYLKYDKRLFNFATTLKAFCKRNKPRINVTM